ncbi:MAG TPA: hypothetical protein VEJ18_16880 [Planctomycetota bacterium]|nr:hypothetical protein [Planctomycetota bacterium]
MRRWIVVLVVLVGCGSSEEDLWFGTYGLVSECPEGCPDWEQPFGGTGDGDICPTDHGPTWFGYYTGGTPPMEEVERLPVELHGADYAEVFATCPEDGRPITFVLRPIEVGFLTDFFLQCGDDVAMRRYRGFRQKTNGCEAR